MREAGFETVCITLASCTDPSKIYKVYCRSNQEGWYSNRANQLLYNHIAFRRYRKDWLPKKYAMNPISTAICNALQPTISNLLHELLLDYGKQDFQIRLWDGTTFGQPNHPAFVFVLKRPEALRPLLGSVDELALGEAYIAGDFEVEGDMEAAFDFGDYLLSRDATLGHREALRLALLKLAIHDQGDSSRHAAELRGAMHSKKRDLQAIRYHYDLPPEFFALWLDPYMLYSSAYFSESTDLAGAQRHKLDYICRKLRLQPGDHLLDIGCGWGGLIVYAATNFGVDALGITLSIRQAETARARIRRAGLEKHCRVEVCDYRDIELSRPFDKIVSVGMFEHVGEALLPEYFFRVWRLLCPGGVFLNSGIAAVPSHVRKGQSFVDHYVFPDGELVPIGKTISVAEASGFEVRDVESLREHYAMTLHEWVRKLEAHAEEAQRLTDEVTYRIWRLYMAGSAHRFRSGDLNLYQMLLAKPRHGDSRMPLTRADWYRAEAPGNDGGPARDS